MAAMRGLLEHTMTLRNSITTLSAYPTNEMERVEASARVELTAAQYYEALHVTTQTVSRSLPHTPADFSDAAYPNDCPELVKET